MEDVFASSHGVRLLDGFRMYLFMGETLGLIINNAYKRSLVVDVLCGNREVDLGRIYYHDQQVDPEEYSVLSRRRVASVGGKSFLIQDMSVAENIFVIRSRFKKIFVSRRTLNKQAAILLKPFSVDASPLTPVKSLTITQRIQIELIKASATGARIIILYDLSRFLSAADIATVFETVSALKRDGIAFLLVDTYLDVLFQYTDRMLVMDSGRMIRAFEKDMYDEKTVEAVLLGGGEKLSAGGSHDFSPQVLEIRHVSTNKLQNISLTLHKGEAVSLLDMDGSTNEALFQVLTGEAAYEGGLLLDGKAYKPRHLKHALKKGVCVISENPTETMLFPHLSAQENLFLGMAGRVRFFFGRKKFRRSLAQSFRELLPQGILECQDIRTLGSEDLQRLVYCKWLLCHPKLLIVLKPLSVTDPHLSQITQELIGQYVRQGTCVLILSSNPSEAYRLGDTVYPCKDGKITGNNEYGTENNSD
jgi:ribose transport system ATP-binding protein